MREKLDTIRANVGFLQLQEMRNNSPTGGALGQVSEFENKLLQSVKGSLDQYQSSEQLKANLEQIKNDYLRLKDYTNMAYKLDWKDEAGMATQNNQGASGGIKTADDFLKAKGLK